MTDTPEAPTTPAHDAPPAEAEDQAAADATPGGCGQPNCLRPGPHPGLRHRYAPTRELPGPGQQGSAVATVVGRQIEDGSYDDDTMRLARAVVDILMDEGKLDAVARAMRPDFMERLTMAPSWERPTLTALTPVDGGRRYVGWNTCDRCGGHLARCSCKDGPLEPAIVLRWAAGEFPLHEAPASQEARVEAADTTTTPTTRTTRTTSESSAGDAVTQAAHSGVTAAIERLEGQAGTAVETSDTAGDGEEITMEVGVRPDDSHPGEAIGGFEPARGDEVPLEPTPVDSLADLEATDSARDPANPMSFPAGQGQADAPAEPESTDPAREAAFARLRETRERAEAAEPRTVVEATYVADDGTQVQVAGTVTNNADGTGGEGELRVTDVTTPEPAEATDEPADPLADYDKAQVDKYRAMGLSDEDIRTVMDQRGQA